MPSTTAVPLTCLIIGISDGDTLTARCSDTNMKIRLAEIDAPEKKQPFGTKSKDSLADLCFQKEAVIRPVKKDRYQRTIATIECQGKDAGKHQLARGTSWVYDQYVTDTKLYTVQTNAQKQRIGLWSEAHPTPPWSWR